MVVEGKVEEIAHDCIQVEAAEEGYVDDENMEESSSLLNEQEKMEGEDLSERVSTQSNSATPSLEPCEDHPLRALSCASIDCVSETSFIPEVTLADVCVSIKNLRDQKVEFKKGIVENREQPGSEHMPLNPIIHLDSNRPQNRWGAELGYKNWLMHLGHRRRCEILILVGFFMWIGFFLVLAIVLNGNASKASGTHAETVANPGTVGGEVLNKSNQTTKPLRVLNMTKFEPTRSDVDRKTATDRPTSEFVKARVSQTLSGKEAGASRRSNTSGTHAETVANPGTDGEVLNKSNHTTKPLRVLNMSKFEPTRPDVDRRTATDRPTNEFVKARVSQTLSGKEAGASRRTNTSIIEETSTLVPDVGDRVTEISTDRSTKPFAEERKASELVDGRTSVPTINETDTLVPDVGTRATETSNYRLTEKSFVEGRMSSEPIDDPLVKVNTSLFDSSLTVGKTDLLNVILNANTPMQNNTKANYLIGVGRADITGPAADVNMMGYANPSQVSGGIHLRQYSRAFIIEDRKTNIRTTFINIDACMASTLVKLQVLKALRQEFGDLYTAENLCISGTHTHSAPAGFLQDVLFQVSSWGYVNETLSAMVVGIVESIKKAHETMQQGYILMNKGELVGSNINRSPTAYDNNPTEEKAKYKSNVDTEMTLLKFMNEKDEGIGMINWFPVHCTSMNNTNSLISSDNKGYAEILFEKMINPDALTGTGEFVAAFAQSNEGDVSPNTRGPHCIDTGDKCNGNHSTCNGKSQFCVASGPGKDMFDSTKIIGRNQFEKAAELYKSATVKLEGPVKFIHQYVDMTQYEVTLNETTKVKTCKPAMGFSFAAGTTDGPGAFDFKQGDKTGNTFWQIVRNFLHPPSEEQKECHAPKPILLDTGEMESPYEWQPRIVDTQILQIGQFYILALPGEFSTMAGRRLRNAVLENLKSLDPDTQHEGVIAGLANAYSDYITTFEEYQIQRYEGASTIYGPHTALAYRQQYEKLARSLANGVKPKSSPQPPNNLNELYSFLPGVIFDRAPLYKNFGDAVEDVKASYVAGEEVSVKFVGANPRNSLKLRPGNVTFVTVEKMMPNGTWKVILSDADWETKFIWIRTSTFHATSDVIVTWETGKDTEPGKYRITHNGYYKYYSGSIYPYAGKSSTFLVSKN